MAQITNITSEALQATIRRLLPSQQGFGEDLQASNVITPVIDLTPTAEGSALPSYLQTAYTLTDATTYSQNGFGSLDIVNTPGFYQVMATLSVRSVSTGDSIAHIDITDGTTTRNIMSLSTDAVSTGDNTCLVQQFVVCLSAGETLRATCTSSTAFAQGSVRQIADLSGNLVDPTGYTPQ